MPTREGKPPTLTGPIPVEPPYIIDSDAPRHIFIFSPEFVLRVVEGTKRQTVRRKRLREPRPGHIADLRHWTGKPYESPQRLIGERWISNVLPITFTDSSWILINGDALDPEQENEFANADGFHDRKAMWSYFQLNRAIPFTGHLIEWFPEGY